MAASFIRGLIRALWLRSSLRRLVHQEAREVSRRLGKGLLGKLDRRIGREREHASKQIQELHEKLEALARAHADLSTAKVQSDHRLKLLERIVVENDQDRDLLRNLADRLTSKRIRDHVVERLQTAEILTDPYPHLFVERVFPEEFYRLLIESIPPRMFFSTRDPIKRNFSPQGMIAPAKAKAVWGFFDSVLSKEILLPALIEKFGPFLDQHYAEVFGPDFVDRARKLPKINTKGRLMCRRPGYKLEPHMDPKRVFLTSLLYLPKTPDGDELYGTRIFRSDQTVTARYLNTYFPEPDGINCDLVKTLPFRWNSLLVFLNAQAVHGAEIPVDQAPADLERYAFQFYLGPDPLALRELVAALPAERQTAWTQRSAPQLKAKDHDGPDPDMPLTPADP